MGPTTPNGPLHVHEPLDGLPEAQDPPKLHGPQGPCPLQTPLSEALAVMQYSCVNDTVISDADPY